MTRLALVIAIAACSGGQKPTTNAAGSGSDVTVYAKKFALGWGISPTANDASDVFLQATDETGKQTSYPLGNYKGACRVITPAPEMKAVTGVSCSGGVEIDAVVQGADVVVLKGSGGDPMAREEVTRVTAPPGAKVQIGA